MIKLENEFLQVTIATHGAEVRSVFHKEKQREMMWSGDARYWGRVSPVLFPNVGRFLKGRYLYKGCEYHLGQHGFLRDQAFEIMHADAQKVTFSFESNGKFGDVYPFEHSVQITYTLEAKALEVSWTVINKDSKVMYYAIGAHPAFALEPGDAYELLLESDTQAATTQITLKEGLVDQVLVVDHPSPIAVDYETFANDAIIYSNVKAVHLINKKTQDTVVVNMKGFEYVGLWTSVVGGSLSPFVCIEPWMGIADRHDTSGNLKDKLSIKQLLEGERAHYTYTLCYL